jgi:5'-3' exonuclease
MFLVADGNNLAWAGFHSLRQAMGAETPEQLTRAALLGLTQSVVGLAVRRGEPPGAAMPLFDSARPLTRLAVCFDEGRPLRRRSIYPGYQLGREGTSAFRDNETFVLEAISAFIDIARCLPIDVVRGTNTEADDLIAALVLGSGAMPARIASTDRDFLQLVDERVSIYSPVKRLVIDAVNFAEATAPSGSDGRPVVFPRERYLDYRALVGDTSDDLPGIPGLGSLTAARMLAEAPPQTYFEHPGRLDAVLGRRNRKLEELLASGEGRAIYERNRGLMDLRLGAAHFPDLSDFTRRGAWDEPAFRACVARERIQGLDLETACHTFAAVAQAPDLEATTALHFPRVGD